MMMKKEPLTGTERYRKSTKPPSIEISLPLISSAPYLLTRIPNTEWQDAKNSL